MTPTLDATPHVEAGVAAIKAVVATLLPAMTGDVYAFGKVPGTNLKGTGTDGSAVEPLTYIRVSVERRFLSYDRMTGNTGRVGWRMSVRAVSDRADNARLAMFAATTGLNETRLTVDGHLSTPLQHESTNDLDYDDGRYVADANFTYTC